MALKQRLKLGEDVVEKIAWGVDLCTQVNLVDVLPREVSGFIDKNGQHIHRQVLVAKKLNFAIQRQGEHGYDMIRALRYIIDADLSDEILASKYTEHDQRVFRIVLQAIENLEEKASKHFRIHTKGVGIFCNKREGIACNTLVIEYFGEIYRQWHWYEKQDVIK